MKKGKMNKSQSLYGCPRFEKAIGFGPTLFFSSHTLDQQIYHIHTYIHYFLHVSNSLHINFLFV